MAKAEIERMQLAAERETGGTAIFMASCRQRRHWSCWASWPGGNFAGEVLIAVSLLGLRAYVLLEDATMVEHLTSLFGQ